MSKPIEVKFDNTLELPEVEKYLYPTSVEEEGQNNNDISEIKITGTFTPLIMINKCVIQWQQVLNMTLDSSGFLPTLTFTIIDVDNRITLLATPGPDNIVILEILPRFENIYKKIKLPFYITSVVASSGDKNLTISCEYYVKNLNDCDIRSYGMISTYNFYDKVAHQLKLGLCSNLEDTQDRRYIYLPSISYRDSLIRERSVGGTPTCILDSWIDWWNNVNLVDMYDLYGGEPDKNLSVWVMNPRVEVDSRDPSDKPYEVDAIITNNYKLKTHPLYTDNLVMFNSNKGNVVSGTDRALNTYDMRRDLDKSILLQDGSGVKDNIYIKYYYRGEFYNGDNTYEPNYLIQQDVANLYKQKVDNNTIQVVLSFPCLGLMRGGKVNVTWYDGSMLNDELYKKAQDMESNTEVESLDDEEEDKDIYKPGVQRINKKISGQYLIVGTSIVYDRMSTYSGPAVSFKQVLTLSRKVESFNYVDVLE